MFIKLLISTLLILGLIASTEAATYKYDLRKKSDNSFVTSKTVNLRVGDKLQLIFDENETTGYSNFLNSDENAGIFKVKKNEYVAPAGDLLGASGIRKYVVKATAIGDGHIKDVYAKSWEFDNTYNNPTYDIKVSIKK